MGSSLVKLSSIKQLKGLELIYLGAVIGNTQYAVKGVSMEVKQTILRLWKKKKSIRDSRNVRSDQINSLVHSEGKKCTGELGNSERPGRPQKRTVGNDRRILSMVKKNPFTTSTQVKKTLQEVGVLLSKSTIKERLHESKCKGFTTGCKPSISLKIRKTQINFAKKHLKKPAHFWKNILWTNETKINLNQNDGKKKVWRIIGTTRDPKHTTSSVKHDGYSVIARACMASNGTGSLVCWQIYPASHLTNLSTTVGRELPDCHHKAVTTSLSISLFTILTWYSTEQQVSVAMILEQFTFQRNFVFIS